MKKIPEMDLNEVTVLALKILASDKFNKYFSMKQLRDLIIVSKHNIPERYLFGKSEYSPLQRRVAKQLNHVFREFQSLGYIWKYSVRFWEHDKNKIKKDERLNAKEKN